MTRLSSDSLFHYKRDVNVLCSILHHGFRHSMWKETLPFRDAMQANFICCFCDILPNQAAYHSECYGKNALGLTKQWGIKNNISPVRYVHETSVGASKEYHALKLLLRSADALSEKDENRFPQSYLCAGRLYASGEVKGDIGLAVRSDPLVLFQYSQIERQVAGIFESIPDGPMKDAFFVYLTDLFRRIRDLHNELEVRDAFTRAYVEDFKPKHGDLIPKKVLYDEREWRSIKMIEGLPDGSHLNEYENAIKNEYLPPAYNLRFTRDDLSFVVVENEAGKKTVRDYVSANNCLVSLDDIAAKLVTLSELKNL